MKARRKVEKFIAGVEVATSARRDREVLQDVLQARTQSKQRGSQGNNPRQWRTVMRCKSTRVAAVIALVVVVAGLFGVGGGSVAFSQAGRAVNSTLTRLREMIVEIRTGEPRAQAPKPAAPSGEVDEKSPDLNRRIVTCAARFFNIPQTEQAPWQSLKDQGIELIEASTDPETYYATLSREQAGHFEGVLTVGPRTSPRVTMTEGEQGMIGTDVFALAWSPAVSGDNKRIESTFSFHDGQNGFEIPNVSAEEGGVVLVRVRGIIPTGEDVLILLKVSAQQAR